MEGISTQSAVIRRASEDQRAPATETSVERAETPGIALVNALAQSFSGDPFELQGLADDLMRCTAGPTLDLSGIDVWVLQDMTPPAWAALQLHAQAQADCAGITSVYLGEDAPLDRSLVDGLKQLSTLKSLFVSPSFGCTEIDFGDLQGPNLAGESVRLEGLYLSRHSALATEILVPTGTHVELTATVDPSLQKSLVFDVDAENRVSHKGRTLHGQLYDHTVAPSMRRPGETGEDAQRRVRRIKLNLAVEKNDRLVVCRNLAGRQLNDLVARRLSYENYSTPEAISSHFDQGVNASLSLMIAEGSCALFEPDLFGQAVAHQFAQLQPGDVRHFAVTTGNHMLGIELLAKSRPHRGQMRSEYVVNLYDPTNTATHKRLVMTDLSRLGTMKLTDWVSEDLVDEYFTDGEKSIGSFYQWPPGQAARPAGAAVVPVTAHVSDETLASAPMLYASLDEGHVEKVRESVTAMCTQRARHWIGQDELAQLLIAEAGPVHQPALYWAIDSGDSTRPEAVKEYVKLVLDIPVSQLSPAAKMRVLQAQSKGKIALSFALSSGRTDAMKAIVEEILQPRQQGMTAPQRLTFLLSASQSGQPMLSEMGGGPPPSTAQLEAVHDFLLAVFNSPELSDEEKGAICASAYGPPGAEITAAKSALIRGNPAMAATMQMAVLESSASAQTKDYLMARLGVSTQEINAASSELQQRAASSQGTSALT